MLRMLKSCQTALISCGSEGVPTVFYGDVLNNKSKSKSHWIEKAWMNTNLQTDKWTRPFYFFYKMTTHPAFSCVSLKKLFSLCVGKRLKSRQMLSRRRKYRVSSVHFSCSWKRKIACLCQAELAAGVMFCFLMHQLKGSVHMCSCFHSEKEKTSSW